MAEMSIPGQSKKSSQWKENLMRQVQPMLLRVDDMPKVRLCKVLGAAQIKVKSTPLDELTKATAKAPGEVYMPVSDGLRDAIWRMIRACISDDGIGLAAPQIGIFKQIFVIQENEQEFRVYFHPRFTVNPESKWEVAAEGCLSVPGKRIPVSRATVIDAEWLELNLESGKVTEHQEQLQDHKARVFQHEHDHLQGLSILSRQAKTK